MGAAVHARWIHCCCDEGRVHPVLCSRALGIRGRSVLDRGLVLLCTSLLLPLLLLLTFLLVPPPPPPRQAAAAVVVYDVTNPQSFERAQNWVKELQRQSNAQNVCIALAGNKVDKEPKAVSAEMAKAYADENGLLFMETSAKKPLNVNELFVAIARKLPKGTTSGAPKASDVILDGDATETESKGCCK